MRFYYQDLNDRIPKKYWSHARCWLNNFGFEWLVPSEMFGFKIGLADYNYAVSMNIHLLLFSAYFHWENYKVQTFISNLIKRKDKEYGNGRVIGLNIHDGIICIDLWKDPMVWHSKDPKWWSFNIDLADIILGDRKYSKEVLEERDVEIPMPEGNYNAKARLELCTWKRPRWFKLQDKYVDFDILKPIPFEGKGTTDYNCGIDGTTGISLKAKNIPDGVGQLVGSMLERRIRNGGWKDWKFEREEDEAISKNKTNT